PLRRRGGQAHSRLPETADRRRRRNRARRAVGAAASRVPDRAAARGVLPPLPGEGASGARERGRTPPAPLRAGAPAPRGPRRRGMEALGEEGGADRNQAREAAAETARDPGVSGAGGRSGGSRRG